MRSVFVLLSALPLLLATAGASHAQYDLSGRWLVSGATTFLDETTPYTNRHWDVVQGAGTITVTRSNEDGVVIGTHDGTINEVTGAFHIDLPVPYPGMSGSIDGTVAGDSLTFTATGVSYACTPHFVCFPAESTLNGTRCGNGQPDDGEQCDDDNADGDDCCSPSCTFDAIGAACDNDENGCTDDVCDGAGACQHTFNSDPCDTGCLSGTCTAGACAPSSPLPPGTPCDLDADQCTADLCDDAGNCTAGGALDCAPCGVCDAGLGCVVESGVLSGCETEPGIVSLKLGAGGGRRNKVSVDFERYNSVFLTEHIGDPTSDTDYTLCVYAHDEYGPAPVVMSATIPAGGTCGDKPCWLQRNDAFTDLTFIYKNRERTPDGVKSVKIRRFGGIRIRGGGDNLRMPAALPAGYQWYTPVVIADGVERHCWVEPVPPSRLTPTQFKGTSQP